jgi:hypothetical protein
MLFSWAGTMQKQSHAKVAKAEEEAQFLKAGAATPFGEPRRSARFSYLRGLCGLCVRQWCLNRIVPSGEGQDEGGRSH